MEDQLQPDFDITGEEAVPEGLIDPYALRNINLMLNCLSLASGMLVLFMIVGLRFIDKELVNRVSLRFALGIAICDAVRAGTIIMYSYQEEPGVLCTMIGYGLYGLTLTYLFLTAAIAANLHIVFIHGRKFNPVWEFYYWFIAIFSALFISGVPLVARKYGHNPYYGCGFEEIDVPDYKYWVGFTHTIWVVLSIGYCTYVVFGTAVALNAKSSVIDKISDIDPLHAVEVKSSIRRLVRRVVCYCAIPFITQIFHLILTLYEMFVPIDYQVGAVLDILSFLNMITSSSAGFFNLLAFCIDPAFINAFQVLKDRNIFAKPHIKLQESPFLDLKSSNSPSSFQSNIEANEKDRMFISRASSTSAYTNQLRSNSEDVALINEAQISSGGEASNGFATSTQGTSSKNSPASQTPAITLKSFIRGI